MNNTFICFVIAMVFLYIVKLFTGGFDLTELMSFVLMVILVGTHVYLSTKKKFLGIVIPIFIIISFYPVYKMVSPTDIELISLVVAYIIALGSCIFIWYKARKDIGK